MSIGWSGAWPANTASPSPRSVPAARWPSSWPCAPSRSAPATRWSLAAYDYPGNFLAVHAVGARPVLADVAPDDWNLDLHSLAEALGPAVRAVIVSHLHGGLVPMRELTDLVSSRNVAVVEDAAQAPGAMVQGRRAGSWGDVGVLSFGGSKLLTAGPRRCPADRPRRREPAPPPTDAPGRKCAISPLRTPGRRAGAAARPSRRAQRPPPPGRRTAGRTPPRHSGAVALPGPHRRRSLLLQGRFPVRRRSASACAGRASPPPCGRRASPWTRDSAPCTSAGRRIAIAAATR